MADQHPVAYVIRLFGGQAALARTLRLTQASVWAWGVNNRVPSKRIPQIIAAAAQLTPPVHLRPDNFFDLPSPGVSGAAAEGART